MNGIACNNKDFSLDLVVQYFRLKDFAVKEEKFEETMRELEDEQLETVRKEYEKRLRERELEEWRRQDRLSRCRRRVNKIFDQAIRVGLGIPDPVYDENEEKRKICYSYYPGH